MKTSPLIWGANQWTGFYMITASVLKGLKEGKETFWKKMMAFFTSRFGHIKVPSMQFPELGFFLILL